VRLSELIWVGREAKFFCKGGWTGFTDLPVEARPLQQITVLRKSAATSQISEWEKWERFA
jgi:hypothetical protein